MDYFDPRLRHEEIARRYPIVMKTTVQFEARQGRDMLLARGSMPPVGVGTLYLPALRHSLVILGS